MKADQRKRIENLEEQSGIGQPQDMLVLSDGRRVPCPGRLDMYILDHGYEYDGAEIVDLEQAPVDGYVDALSRALMESEREIAQGKWDPRVDMEQGLEMHESGVYDIDTEVLLEWHSKKTKAEYLEAWEKRQKAKGQCKSGSDSQQMP